jgi:hypothetical protein
MRISRSEGRVTVAFLVSATVTSSSLLSPEVLQHDVQLLEPLGPRLLVALHPVVDGLERPAVQPVQAWDGVQARPRPSRDEP